MTGCRWVFMTCRMEAKGFVGYVSYREGGTLIEYEDEDPQVRADFAAEMERKGIEFAMPPVTYRS